MERISEKSKIKCKEWNCLKKIATDTNHFKGVKIHYPNPNTTDEEQNAFVKREIISKY